jgi:hypothetical protein
MSDKTQALLAIINSVAAEQEAIARLIDGETAKLKTSIEDLISGEIPPRAEELLLMQNILSSVTQLIESTTKLEEKLTEKLGIATNHLPPEPPCPECPECPECPPCPEPPPCPPCPPCPTPPRPPQPPCPPPRPTPPCPSPKRNNCCFSCSFFGSLCGCLCRRQFDERCDCNRCRDNRGC